MEKEEKNQRPCKPPETDFFLQWGNRKRLKCVRVRHPDVSNPSNSGRIRRKISSRSLALSQKDTSFPPAPSRLTRNSETAAKNRKSSASSEKEDRFYTTRGSVVGLYANGKVSVEGGGGQGGDDNRALVWQSCILLCQAKGKGRILWP